MGLRFSAGPQAGATAIHPIAVPTEPRTTCPHFGPLGGVWGGVRPSLGSSGGGVWGGVRPSLQSFGGVWGGIFNMQIPYMHLSLFFVHLDIKVTIGDILEKVFYSILYPFQTPEYIL